MKEEYVTWLIENLGKYEIIKDNSYWTREDGSKCFNKFSISYKGTCISFTADMGLEGCIDYFKENK